MKWIIFCSLLVSTWSCMVKNNDYSKKRDPVNITSLILPETALVSQPIEIKTIAQANNGCWHDFNFKLVKISDFHYAVKADAIYESRGICAQVIVEKDTTLTFIPGKTGRYIFHANDAPFTAITDTLIVN